MRIKSEKLLTVILSALPLALLFAPGCAPSEGERGVASEIVQTPLFVAGQGGYHTYRIPALLSTPKGTLLAFCEGRKTRRDDDGDIDLLVKRSSDGGGTWSEQTIVYEEGGDAEITIGNPSPVVDEDTGTIWTRISVLALARPQYTSAPARMPRLFALNPAHPLRR